MEKTMNHLKINPNSKILLGEINANDSGEWEGKKEDAKKRLLELTIRLDQLQEILYAEHKHKVLIILQGLDGGGKDGTIRAVFDGVNPQGVQVANFKAPSSIELDHDYLWRIHAQVPKKGEIVIFNRSHYEDVLIVRVHNLVGQDVWEKRYQHILEFERMLSDEGTVILKFFLYIDQEEQKKRFLERLADPTKQWKFNPNDLQERKLWDKYMLAYEAMLNKTSSEFAPWYLIPSNRNWYRNLVIASIIVEKLESLNMQYPVISGDIQQYTNELQAS
jgi:PPK2 family polyphosphate:nucleotide phosphotransferase